MINLNSNTWANQNRISDKGIEDLTQYIIGNTSLKVLNVSGATGITTASIPQFVEMAKKSCLNSITLYNEAVSWESQDELCNLLDIPIDQREIPIYSSSKSAAKSSSSS